MDANTFWAIFFITCAVYYTVKNWMKLKAGKDDF